MDLATRVKSILMSPAREWPVIAQEPADIASLYTGYIVPLAAIPPICGVVGGSIVGIMGYRTGFGVALGLAITRYVLALVAAYVAAVVASKLAPAFGGRESIVQGLKLIAYSATASWIGGVFGLIPVLSFVAIVFSLYSLYLLFIGAAAVMSVPESRAVGYAAAVIVVTIAVYVAVALVGERIISMM